MSWLNPFSQKRQKLRPTRPTPPPMGASIPMRIKPRFQKIRLSSGEYKEFLKTSASVPLHSNLLADHSLFFKQLFSTATRYIPSVSNAVWIWQNLCSTGHELQFVGGTDAQRKRAREIILDLSGRIAPFSFVHNGAGDILVNQFFLSLFKYGRFAGEMILDPNLTGVADFKFIDPFTVKFTKNLQPYTSTNNRDFYPANPNTFYYYGMGMDLQNPYGSAMLESVRTLIQMANDMISDMTQSSSNAGVPRLHIKVRQPEQHPYEDDEEYRTRMSSYFTNTVNQFSEIGADDNFFSWEDVTIAPVSGHTGGTGFVWKTNLSILDEEIISGFHLYPWVLAKSFSTTKNWVRSQFDILMVQVESLQKEASRFLEWISNTELQLKGITEVKVNRAFKMLRDPAFKDIAVANRFQLSNIRTKILSGFITPDDGARELGYDKAVDPELIFKQPAEDDKPVTSDDNTAEILQTLNDISERLDNMQGTNHDNN